MDVAVIDWNDSKFEKDQVYEDINAPQWIDFSDHDPPVDDEAWFCRPDCNHPKTVEDFFRQRTTDSSKVQRPASVSETPPLGDRNRRDAALKKRGLPLKKDSKIPKCVQDSENQNPNFSTPSNHKAKSIKESIKSSAEQKQAENGFSRKEEMPRRLKSTLSARNLFAGKDILNQITDFCNELKRLAMKTKERADDGEKESLVSGNETKPLLEIKKEKLKRTKRNGESENSPVMLNLKSIRGKDEERVLQQIRTNPPSPQCFSANHGTAKAGPPKAFRPRPPEVEEEGGVKVNANQGRSGDPVLTEKEARALDVFWFLKPCTLST